mgnify:CR=1 FL=1
MQVDATRTPSEDFAPTAPGTGRVAAVVPHVLCST